MNFNENLKHIRKSKNLTQQRVSDLLNISIRTYQNYEQGTREPSLMLFCKIADIFEVTTDELLGRKPLKD